jgi:chaperonin GroEL (HSP60 family)
MTFVTGCKNPKAVSILIRGGTEHVVEEVERIMHDALRVTSAVVEDGTALAGGGASDLEASMRLRDYAASQGGREQLAIEAFSKALEIVPWTLAENAGLNMIDTIIELKSAHEGKRGANMGIDVFTGKPSDMRKANVIEPLRVKTQAIESATEAATMILRIDDVIASRRTEAPKGGGEEGHGGMPPGMGGMGGM